MSLAESSVSSQINGSPSDPSIPILQPPTTSFLAPYPTIQRRYQQLLQIEEDCGDSISVCAMGFLAGVGVVICCFGA
jgi:hypothetical protein